MVQRIVHLTFFPHDGKYWRINWFGHVGYPVHLLSSYAPSIWVTLSSWPDADLDNARVQNASGANQIQVQAPVGYLVSLKIGDIWRNGVLVASPEYQKECFTDISINSKSTRIIKAGLSTIVANRDVFYLPLGTHPYHIAHAGAYCLLVHLSNSKRLVIPAVELIRFYFGSSSVLVRTLFRFPLTQNKLWTHAKQGTESERSSIDLAAGISGSSAEDIARMAFSARALRAAQLVGDSLCAENVNRQQLYPRALFPFVGKTTLQASGMWLPFGKDPASTFLAYNLLSCSHKFPFRNLDYRMPGRSFSTGGFEKKVSDSPPNDDNSQKTPVAAKRSSKNYVEEDASKNLSTVEVVIGRLKRFTYLEHKSVRRVEELASAEVEIQLSPGKDISAASVGTAGIAGDIRPVDLVQQSEWSKQGSKPYLLMREVVAELSISGKFDKVEMVYVEQSDKLDIFISYYDALMRYREELSDLSVSQLSNMQIAVVIAGRVKAFLMVAGIDLPLKLSPFCIVVIPDSAKKALTVKAEVLASLDALRHSGAENEFGERMQYFLAVPDITLESDISEIVQQLCYHVELYCEEFQSTGI